jgi:hypothetical protein
VSTTCILRSRVPVAKTHGASYMALRDERDMDGTNLRTGTPSGPFLSRLKTPSLLLLAACQSGSRPWLNNRIGQEMQRVSITVLRTRLPSPKEPLLPATPSSLLLSFLHRFKFAWKMHIHFSNEASVPDPLRIRGMQPYSLLRLVSSTWLSEQWMKRYFRDLFFNLWRSPG